MPDAHTRCCAADSITTALSSAARSGCAIRYGVTSGGTSFATSIVRPGFRPVATHPLRPANRPAGILLPLRFRFDTCVHRFCWYLHDTGPLSLRWLFSAHVFSLPFLLSGRSELKAAGCCLPCAQRLYGLPDDWVDVGILDMGTGVFAVGQLTYWCAPLRLHVAVSASKHYYIASPRPRRAGSAASSRAIGPRTSGTSCPGPAGAQTDGHPNHSLSSDQAVPAPQDPARSTTVPAAPQVETPILFPGRRRARQPVRPWVACECPGILPPAADAVPAQGTLHA